MRRIGLGDCRTERGGDETIVTKGDAASAVEARARDRRDHPRYPLPDGAVTEPLDDRLEPNEFTPRLLALLSNALVWRESQELRRRFGLGTNEWRVISALAVEPGRSATEVGVFLGSNKAVVSKSVGMLAERGLIVLADGPRGSRPLYLTAAGVEMHAQMLPISLGGQEIILEGMSPRDVTRLNSFLRDGLARIRISDGNGNGIG